MDNFKIDDRHTLIFENNGWTVYTDGVAQTEIPKFLYKYYSLKKEHLDALKFGYLGINNPKNFNDPFDCCNNLIVEKQRDPVDGQPTPFINDIPNLGVSCFSTNGLNPLMWGHYARSYIGFVVKFKSDFKIVRTPEMHSDKLISVIYSDNPTPASISHPFSEDYQFVVKLKHWEYEDEWRLIIKKNDINLDKVYYSKDCIEEILIGYKAFPSFNDQKDKDNYHYLMDILKSEYPNVKTFTVGPHEKNFHLYKRQLLINPDIKDFKIVLR